MFRTRTGRWLTSATVMASLAVLSFAFRDQGLTYSRFNADAPSSHHTFGPAIGPATNGRIPGQFEHQDALLLGVNELIDLHPQTLVDIMSAVDGRLQIIGLISSPQQELRTLELLQSRGVSTGNLHFFLWPAASMWVQDFGPVSLLNGDVRIIDFGYEVPGCDAEDELPMAFAATFGMKIAHCRLTFEGGNMLSNGKGLCISSTTLIEQNKARGYDLMKIGSILKSEFCFSQWTYLPPLEGETTGHIDMFLTLASPTTAVLGECPATDDPQNARRLDEAAEILSKVNVEGQSMRVVRIPKPPHHDEKYRTYTNVIYANGVLLVPQYPDCCPDLDRRALEVYREVLPDWKIVGIDASKIINNRGSLHCLSLNLPSMPDLTSSE